MIPLKDSTFDSLNWAPVDGIKLDTLLQGLTVVGAEPIGHPLTDGVIIYLRDASGSIIVLDMGITERNCFYARKATVEQDIATS